MIGWVGWMVMGCVHPSLPGRPHRAALPPANAELTQSAERIEQTVQHLAGEIGPRSLERQPEALRRAADYIENTWRQQGFQVERQAVTPATDNLIVRIPGAGPPLVVGAHYDTVASTPGADDNASGVAALLEITRQFAPPYEAGREILFVAWTTEEPPYFRSQLQGSAVHAASLDDVFAAISLETLGLYSSERKSQHYPFPLSVLYPNRGSFVAFVADNKSHRFVREVGRRFRKAEAFPTRGGTAPRWVTGIDWSDHRSYWPLDAPALMVTDTALFRNPHYHRMSDTPDVVDPMAIARVARGMAAVVDGIRQAHPTPSLPTLAPLTVSSIQPQRVDMIRGATVVVKGTGFDPSTQAQVGPTTVPVTRRVDDRRLDLQVDDFIAGTYNLTLTGRNGAVCLPDALVVHTGDRPMNPSCHATVAFDLDSDEVSTAAAKLLERERFCFTAYQEPIAVVGHTDPSGSASANADLGLRRAQEVAALLARLGIAESRLVVSTRGETAGRDLTDADRRRVDIELVVQPLEGDPEVGVQGDEGP